MKGKRRDEGKKERRREKSEIKLIKHKETTIYKMNYKKREEERRKKILNPYNTNKVYIKFII